jgi:SAM-dependent methyltransferase
MFIERSCPLCASTGQLASVAPHLDPTTCTESELRAYWAGFRAQQLFFPYGRCSNCGMLYARRYFDDPALQSLYGSMAENMAVAGSENTAATQIEYVSVVEPHVKQPGDFLEIGPDTGVFAKECARRGLIKDHVWLFEPNRNVWDGLRALQDRGKIVHLSERLDDLDVPDGSVGLAAAVHVIDHVVDPVTLLGKVRRKMQDGGILLLVCHNERSLLSRILRRRWPAYCLQHPHLFNPRSLRSIVERAGFRVLQIRRTTNRFSVHFLLETLLRVVFGVSVRPVLWLDKVPVRLPLGNIAAVATV